MWKIDTNNDKVLFYRRCLAKMQRAGKAHCPLCRATTVLQADRCELIESVHSSHVLIVQCLVASLDTEMMR